MLSGDLLHPLKPLTRTPPAAGDELMRGAVEKEVEKGLEFLHGQTEFWRQQDPLVDEVVNPKF